MPDEPAPTIEPETTAESAAPAELAPDPEAEQLPAADADSSASPEEPVENVDPALIDLKPHPWWNRRRMIYVGGGLTLLIVLLIVFVMSMHRKPVDRRITVSGPMPATPPVALPKPAAAPSIPKPLVISGPTAEENLQALIDSLPASGTEAPEPPEPAAPKAKPATPAAKAVAPPAAAVPSIEAPPSAPENEPAAGAPEKPSPVSPPRSDVTSKFFIGSTGLPEWKGAASAVTSPRTVVIKSADEWKRLWREHSGSAKKEVPEIDFENYMVVGVFAGRKPAGHAVEIVNTDETLPPALDIYYKETTSNDDSKSAVTPYHLWVVSRSALPVRFKKIE
jgi:hypothetical protein